MWILKKLKTLVRKFRNRLFGNKQENIEHMQLEYLWIYDYQNIKKQGFNFSQDYDYEFELDESSIDKKNDYITEHKMEGTLIQTESTNKYKIANKFLGREDSVIKNINAIIGGNGAGKTTLLKFIIDVFYQSSGTRRNGNYIPFIAIVGNGQSKKIYIHENIKCLNLGTYFADPYVFTNCSYYDTFFKKSVLLYYSGIVNNNFEVNNVFSKYQTNKFRNLSTDSLLIHSHREYANQDTEDKMSKASSLEVYQRNELLKQVEFILDNDKFDFPFPLPKYFKIEFPNMGPLFGEKEENDPLNVISNTDENIETVNIDGAEIDFKSKIHSTQQKIQSIYTHIQKMKLSRKEKMLRLLLLNHICAGAIYPFQNYSSTVFWGDTLEKLEEKYIKVNKFNYKSLSEDKKFSEDFEKVYTFFEGLDDACFYKDDCIYILIGNKSLDFIESYFNTILFNGYLNISWGTQLTQELSEPRFETYSLSAGENIFFSMFARLFYIKKHSKLDPYTRNITLLIDEAENHFHPSMQKKYVSYLIDFISKIFTDPDYKIHIIFTSHSPLVISDLFEDQIIFMEKNKDTGNCIIHTQNEGIVGKTFNSNLYSLLRNDFFMKNDNIQGEFSEEVIKSLLNKLIIKQKDSKSSNISGEVDELDENINIILNSIGDEIEKTKLSNYIEFIKSEYYDSKEML